MNRYINPFVTYGYESPEYFCDRKEETQQLIRLLTNGNHVALISPRRIGKTGLIHHCFNQENIQNNYITFLIDIYATKSLSEFVYQMGQSIVKKLRPWGQTAIDRFLQTVTSLRTGISLDGFGKASWNIEVGDIQSPRFTLDEIFNYLNNAERPCIVAIDEFQAIGNYPEKDVEALLRTYIQECRNAVFVLSGSQRHVMNEMFSSPARPFYQSVSLMNISSIPLDAYCQFATYHFEKNNKTIDENVVVAIYERFDQVTWYIQKMLNELFSITPPGEKCSEEMVEVAIEHILGSYESTYQDNLLQLTQKQVMLLKAICKEKRVVQLTSGKFIKTHHLDSASSVQKAAQTLLNKQIITHNANQYEIYDKFMGLWLELRNAYLQ